MTSSDLESRRTTGQNFPVNLDTLAQFDLTVTKVGTVTLPCNDSFSTNSISSPGRMMVLQIHYGTSITITVFKPTNTTSCRENASGRVIIMCNKQNNR